MAAPFRVNAVQRFLDALSALQRRHALGLFLGLGTVLFVVDAWQRREPPLEAPVAAGENPRQWLEDEVLYREALARGLDDGDLIVRRRLVQKMRLLLEAGVDVPEPTEAQLQAWVEAHPARYGGLAQLSLEQVFLSRGRHDAALPEAAAAVGRQLRGMAAVDPAALGDPHPAGGRLDHADPRTLERLFGGTLAAQLADLPQGDWQGPLASSLGLHFVRLLGRETRTPDLAAVRERAQRDWLLEQRRVQTRLALERLKAQHGLGRS